jgi:predicted dehydrogenase
MMSERVRCGVLSTARINEKVVAGGRASERIEVIAVASRRAAAAEAYASAHGIEEAYGSYDEMLADEDVEAVYISLPNALHLEWSVRALQAGKHVLCEKPLSRSAAAVEQAFDVAQQCDRLLMEAFMYRHNPQIARLAQLTADGAIGRPSVVSASFGFHVGDLGDPRMSRELDGGALMDVGCYCVNAARLLCGEPERVQGEQSLGGDGVDVAFAGVMRFADGMLAHFDCGLLLDKSEELTVHGDRGSLHLADPWRCLNAGIELRRDVERETIAVDTLNSYTLQWDNLAAAIRGDGAPLLGRSDAIGQARTIEALYTSAQEHRTVTM